MTESAFIEAAKCGNTPVVRALLDNGASIEERTAGGDTALIWAANNGQVETVRLLLDRRASIEQRGGAGYTPLGIAALAGHLGVVQILLSRGADINACSSAGESPLALALKNGKAHVADYLAKAMQKPAETMEEWVKMGASTVAFVGNYPHIAKKLTHIFNFETRERLIIAQNLETKTEVITPPTGFDDLPSSAVEKALEKFQNLGGAADRDFVLRGVSGLSKSKPGLISSKS